jgi:hypothetical protein
VPRRHIEAFIVSESAEPHKSAVLTRDNVQIGLTENGGGPTQGACAFHVQGLEAIFAEFHTRGLNEEKEIPPFNTEQHGDVSVPVPLFQHPVSPQPVKRL